VCTTSDIVAARLLRSRRRDDDATTVSGLTAATSRYVEVHLTLMTVWQWAQDPGPTRCADERDEISDTCGPLE